MKKILLATTSRHFFLNGSSLLERDNFQFFQAQSAEEALEIHRKEKVNLMLADLDLPATGGDALCESLRKELELCTVSFLMVCNDNPVELQRSRQSGANVCLAKPLKAQTLFTYVEKLLTVSVRKDFRILLRMKVQEGQDDAEFFCTTKNLSISGMLIDTNRPRRPGDRLSCSFHLPDSFHIKTEGEVVRIEVLPDGIYRCGIRFTTITPDQVQAIELFIADQLKLGKPKAIFC